METRFKVLRLFAVLQVMVGVFLLLFAVVVLLAMAKIIGSLDDRTIGIATSSYGVVVIVGLIMAGIASIAYGQFLEVVMQMERYSEKLKFLIDADPPFPNTYLAA